MPVILLTLEVEVGGLLSKANLGRKEETLAENQTKSKKEQEHDSIGGALVGP
jgi:hypothetical protein